MDLNYHREMRKARKAILDKRKMKNRPASLNLSPILSTPCLTINQDPNHDVATASNKYVENHNANLPDSYINTPVVSVSSNYPTRHNLEPRYSNISPVPMVGFTALEEGLHHNIDYSDHRTRRKLRKLILDNKRSKGMSAASSQYSITLGASSNVNIRTPLSDITNGISTTTQASSQRPAFIASSSQNHRLKRKYINISPIPMVDLTSALESNARRIIKDIYVGISKDYIDHGDQNVICGICQARLWKDESQRGVRTRSKNSYSLCCSYGNVELPDAKEPQENFKNLFRSFDSKSKFFLNNIRRYNSMFSFTSMGGKIDSSINKGNAPFIFRLSGQNYHSIGSLLPPTGSKPKFSQLYIFDTDNEVSNRQSVIGSSKNGSESKNDKIDIEIINYLKSMLDYDNQLVKSYRMVRDSFQQNPQLDLKLRLIGKRVKDGRTYNLPTASEVAALIVGDIADCMEKRDIIIKTQTGELKRISELHPSYLPLHYPLLFPYGEDGYRVDILHRGVTPSNKTKRPNLTMREFFAYRIQDRVNKFSLILNSRRLYQQFLVDAYTMIECERLNYIRYQQKNLRCETYEKLRNAQHQENVKAANIGQRVILPSSFTGGARYMMQNYLDAMSLCKWFGYPDFFITMTCNPKWPEVKRFLKDTTVSPEDRPDILCRLFKIKLDALIKDLKNNELLGKVEAVVYTVEFQKRGLPHAHICLFMHADHKLPTVDLIDPIISAEIPDREEDPELYELVSDFMIHGPCGSHNMKCPCMIDGKCSKSFPKKFREHTSIDSSGFPLYRRRDSGRFVVKSRVKLDSRSVVPYNKNLLKKYQAHINVEWCNQASSIKYLFKYINKGPDRATMSVVQNNNEQADEQIVDEIQEYYDCRYISACEASWRIFSYDVHYRKPSVMRLPFHLPDQQNVVYGADDDLDDVLSKPSVASSIFLGWMKFNELNETARQYTYVQFPKHYVWKMDDRCWQERQRGKSIGRIHSVSPSSGEAYYLRILLNKVKGPTSFEDIRTVDGHLYPSFRNACYALGLLDDDNEYIDAIKEASHCGSGYYLRNLFVTMLTSNTLSMPEFVWEKTWEYLSDGILLKQKRILKAPDLSLRPHQIKNLTLFEIEKILLRNNSTLRNFESMPLLDMEVVSYSNNRMITDELDYDRQNLQNDFDAFSNSLTTEQRVIFDDIMKAVKDMQGGVFFVYGYGGTGKTYLWKTLSAALRSKGEIVLNVASSGIASLLLTGGRTAHSRFSIPLDLNEDSLCHIKPGTDAANLLKKTSLIIWDEAPMVHKHGFEALDRTLKDVLSCDGVENSYLPFGGKVIVFGGDFRQILPVVPNGTRQDIVSATLCSSYIWSQCKVLTLTKNMRLLGGNGSSENEELKNFAKWLLDIGEGKVGPYNDGETIIDIPNDLLIPNSSDPISDLVDFVYPAILDNYNNSNFFQERAILAPTNEVVQEVNDGLLKLIPGDEHEYLSSDSVCESEHLDDNFDPSLCSPDFLNGLKIPGFPNHKLVLKVGVPVMLLRNIDQKNGLCNGTRLKVISLGKRIIEAEVITGSNIGTRTFIPRLSLIPTDKRLAFKFQRRQFPVSVCFAMTINKSQGQSLSRVGLLLKQPVFTHGQLYVALSRVTSRAGLKLLVLDKDGKVTNKTTNVVYKEVFRDL